ncbi:MAG: uracil-DNA glycosylase family protein [Pseudomonadota bacterium]|jgi:uracil-DNA glycosylase
MKELLASIRQCRECAAHFSHEPRPVLQASVTARICVAGQAPGRRAHDSGLPFNDPSGDRLRQWMGVDRTVFYDASKIAIIPMGFCFPGYDAKGGDLPPRPECAPLWREKLFALLPDVKLTLLVGQYSQAWHLGGGRRKNLTETVREWRSYPPRILPLPHPSWRNTGWMKKNPWFEAELLPELRRRVSQLIQ